MQLKSLQYSDTVTINTCTWRGEKLKIFSAVLEEALKFSGKSESDYENSIKCL